MKKRGTKVCFLSTINPMPILQNFALSLPVIFCHLFKEAKYFMKMSVGIKSKFLKQLNKSLISDLLCIKIVLKTWKKNFLFVLKICEIRS